MKHYRPSTVLCIIVLAFLAVGCASILYGTFFAANKKSPTRTAADWAAKYPFAENGTPVADPIVTAPNAVEASGYFNRITSFQSLLDNGRNNLLGYEQLRELCGSFRRLTGQTHTNTAVLLNNGYMTNVVAPADQAVLIEDAASVIALRDAIDVPLLYVQVPQKVCQYDDKMPDGEFSFINENIDRYHKLLEAGGISIFDLRDAIHNQQLDHYSLYFRTDHHWTLSGGLWAAKTIADELITRYDFSVDADILEPSQFSQSTYPEWYLGPLGRAVSAGYIAPDDFTVVYPSYGTSFRVEYPDKEMSLTGSLYQTMFDWDMLSTPCTYDKSAYEALLYGNRPLVQIINNAKADQPKILIIRDSYCSAVAPYLSLVFSEVDLIDVRKDNGDFNGSLTAYIEETQPDLVLVMFCSPCNIDRSDG